MSRHRIALLFVLAQACETETDRRRERLDQLARTLDERLAAADPPAVPHAEPHQNAAVRVIVGDGIDVDRAATAIELYRAEPEGYVESTRPVPELSPTAVALRNGRLPATALENARVPALAEALQPPPPPGSMGSQESQRGMAEHRGALDLVVGAEVPYATLAPVLSTTVHELYSPRLIVKRGDGWARLSVGLPPVMGSCWSRSCFSALVDRQSIPQPRAPDAVRTPIDLTLAIDERGVDVFGSDGALAVGCDTTREPSDNGPTIPRRQGTIDARGVAACLAAIDGELRDDDVVLVQPESTTPFAEVALVASLALQEDRVSEVRFTEPE